MSQETKEGIKIKDSSQSEKNISYSPAPRVAIEAAVGFCFGISSIPK